MKCWLGLHALDVVRIVEVREGSMVEVEVVRCARCGVRIMETVVG